jgi:hypothetical protein
MPIKDPDIFKLIERMGDHYQRNINNQHVRKLFVTLSVSNSAWGQIETLTTKSEYYKYQGYQYEELYDQITAIASLVYQLRQQVVPGLKGLVSRASPGEQVVIKMVAANFPTNLSLLADMINELYLKVTNLDRAEHKAGAAVFEKNPELLQIGHYLVG